VAIAASCALVLAAGVGGTAAVLAYGSSCDLDSLQEVRIGQNTFLYAADGSLLGSIPAERNRQPVTAEGMSLWIRKATIAVEDRRFFDHGGVDVEGIARAAVADLRAGEIVEGGSTITQQLVRNLYISREQTVQRKVKEACLATKLDGTWTKHRILTTYLNQVYYGTGPTASRRQRRRTTRSPRSSCWTCRAVLAGLSRRVVLRSFYDARARWLDSEVPRAAPRQASSRREK
jgi:penicillin-binding protein 1A